MAIPSGRLSSMLKSVGSDKSRGVIKGRLYDALNERIMKSARGQGSQMKVRLVRYSLSSPQEGEKMRRPWVSRGRRVCLRRLVSRVFELHLIDGDDATSEAGRAVMLVVVLRSQKVLIVSECEEHIPLLTQIVIPRHKCPLIVLAHSIPLGSGEQAADVGFYIAPQRQVAAGENVPRKPWICAAAKDPEDGLQTHVATGFEQTFAALEERAAVG